jgi:diol dehydratase reactivase alpha subunit
MSLIAGVDIGNNTTEVALASIKTDGVVRVLASSIVRTIGVKGTLRNVTSIINALDSALEKSDYLRKQLDLVLLNEATPVIGDVAMETITETVITESAMIGHNPLTPGGLGLGMGVTIALEDLETTGHVGPFIATVPLTISFQAAARALNRAGEKGIKVTAAIVGQDDGVLIYNRLKEPMPIVDEVRYIERIPLGMPAVVEVAPVGKSIEKLSNPYDIATLFDLGPEETRNIVPVARALTGTRSAVVIKTPHGEIKKRRIAAGHISLIGPRRKAAVAMEEGADKIMEQVEAVSPLVEIEAEAGTNVGGMFENVRKVMADLTQQPTGDIRVQDIIAVDTLVPQPVSGSLAGEYAMGSAVGLAAMVETQRLPMQRLARKLEEEICVPVQVAGVEAEMAIRGALTTPGTSAPMAILDLGGGSTDASLIKKDQDKKVCHLAGAGDMVTMLIDKELALNDPDLAEMIKFYPLAKVETLFHMRHENGTVQFFNDPVDPRLFGRVVVMADSGPLPVMTREPLDKIAAVRQGAKQKVFVRNALRALKQVAPANNIRLVNFVALVGGSALDFEIPGMISDALMEYGVVTGRANIRGLEGPRNAVATGLVLAHGESKRGANER